jgi:hypothetical protein
MTQEGGEVGRRFGTSTSSADRYSYQWETRRSAFCKPPAFNLVCLPTVPSVGPKVHLYQEFAKFFRMIGSVTFCALFANPHWAARRGMRH